jgi:hypothetical protein
MKYLFFLLLLASCGKPLTDKPGVMLIPPIKTESAQQHIISPNSISISKLSPAKREFNPYYTNPILKGE